MHNKLSLYGLKYVLCSVLILLFFLSLQSIGFSQEISRPVTYSAEFNPLGEGVDWEGKLPDDFDPVHMLFKFRIDPGTVKSEINTDIKFNQENQTLSVEPRYVTDLSNVYVGKFSYTAGVLLSGEIIFDFVIPIPFFPDIPIYYSNPIPGFPQINKGWEDERLFDSLLLEGDSVKVEGGVRDLLSIELSAVDLAELIVVILSQGSLPKRVVNEVGDIIKEYLADGGIRVNGGVKNRFTLAGVGIYVDGQLITKEDQTVAAASLNPSLDTYSIQSRFEERFTAGLDVVVSSDVFLDFTPFGIEVWSYEKEIVEVPIPIIPDLESDNLNFSITPNVITFPIKTEDVPIANNAPESVGTISPQSVQIGDAYTTIDLSDKFTDPDSDILTLSVSTSNPGVVTTQRVGNELTVIPWSAGSATITITATDPHGLTATQTFTVTVLPAAPTSVNRAPTVVGTIAEQSLFVGGFSRTIDVSSYFSDPDGDTLTFDGTSDNTNSVTTEFVSNAMLRMTPGANGSATVTVTATDGEFTATQTFAVIVSTRLIITTNRAPVTQGTISTQTMTAGEVSTTIDVAEFFSDPDGDTLTYAVTSNNTNVVNAQRTSTSSIRLTPIGDGSATITVTASDGTHSVALTFSVTVAPPAVDISDSSDVIVENISADYVTNHPGERFTVSVTVRNAGGRSAPNVRLRYYLSDDDTFSSDDVEYVGDDDFVGGLHSGDSSPERVHLDAPEEEGIYYIIARADPVDNEQTSHNNYQAIKITVLPPPAPDLVVSLVSNRYTVDPNQKLILDATVRNQGAENSRQETTVRFYSSTDANISADDVEIGSDSIRTIRDGRSDRGSHYPRASEQPGTYYFYARVDPLNEERITDNNDSNVITITVRGPDLVIVSAYADYYSVANNEVDPISTFSIYATVRNDGTDRSRSTVLRYYLSTDALLSDDDPEVGASGVSGLSIGESDDERVHGIQPLSTSGFFYLFVCVETDDNDVEISTDNNCSTPIKITVINRPPRTQGTIAPQMLDVGTPLNLNVSTYFTDRNNDTLTFNASSSDDNIATATTSGSQVTITPKKAGSSTITVTANDGTLTATQTVSVSVIDPNRAPLAVGTISALTLTVGDVPEEIDVSSKFSDPDNDDLKYTASSNNTIVATATMTEAKLTITPKTVGNATITVNGNRWKVDSNTDYLCICGSSESRTYHCRDDFRTGTNSWRIVSIGKCL